MTVIFVLDFQGTALQNVIAANPGKFHSSLKYGGLSPYRNSRVPFVGGNFNGFK